MEHYTEETIDLVEIVKRNYPRLNNNLSMREKNKQRRKIKEKKAQVQELFVNVLKDMVTGTWVRNKHGE